MSIRTADRPRARHAASARVRHQAFLASARHRGRQRVRSPSAFVVILVSLLGRSHAAVVQILGSPLVAIVMLLFIGSITYHMRIGMQVIIEDYVHDERWKFSRCHRQHVLRDRDRGSPAVYAMLKLSFGV